MAPMHDNLRYIFLTIKGFTFRPEVKLLLFIQKVIVHAKGKQYAVRCLRIISIISTISFYINNL
jgi:hypothetical protein